QVIDESRENIPELPQFDELREMGVWKVKGESRVALADFRADPQANPLDTPSGKIEILSEALWNISHTWELPAGDKITTLPEHIDTWEGPTEAKTNKQFPLQVIGHHYKQRKHSSYVNVKLLADAHLQVVWINPADASARGV